ncbi:InlB B-repeat-containing protein [Mycoplasmatota bacterium]|nr:InlB B-repeat-containing protein [Mycoplasmatota bacterium]
MRNKILMLSIFFSVLMILASCGKTEKSYTLEEVEDQIVITYGDGDQANYVTQNVVLPTTSSVSEDVTIEWYSLYPSVISIEGSVTRGESDRSVVLTYTISDGDDVLYGNITLTVIGLNDSSTYKISFDSQGGSEVESMIVYEGDLVTEPDDPIKDGYQFVGWYTTDNFTRTFDFDVMPSGDTTVYAKWNYIDENIYTITFDTNGGSAVDPLSENGGVSISAPAEPTKEGFEFAGWYSDQDLVYAYQIAYMPYGNLVLYARWREAVSYEGYYEGADTLVGQSLSNFLENLLSETDNNITYGDARDVLEESDTLVNDSTKLNLIYSLTMKSGNYAKATWDSGATWNREHVWAKSLIGNGYSSDNNTTGVAADAHNLRASDVSVNSSRSNALFSSSTTLLGEYGYDGTKWYPGDDYIGDVARIIFYMDIRWGDETDLDAIGTLQTFIIWHELDPVDEFELNRNNVIYSYQGNRNPFIDHREFVDKIYN